jgi:hypothetical protein
MFSLFSVPYKHRLKPAAAKRGILQAPATTIYNGFYGKMYLNRERFSYDEEDQ